MDAVRSIHRGDTAIDPAVAAKMMSSLRYPRLTHREYEILRLLLLGLSDKAIAARLGRSAGTVKAHVKSVLSKLNATSRTHAVSVARQRGLVQELEPDGQIRKPTTGRRRMTIAITAADFGIAPPAEERLST